VQSKVKNVYRHWRAVDRIDSANRQKVALMF